MTTSNSSARFLFDILERLGATDAPLSLADLRRFLALPAATVHRGLATLEHTGFAERYPASSRFRLGPNGRRLRQAFFARFALRDRALPHLRWLSATTGETSSVSVRVGWLSVRIAMIKGSNAVIYAGATGEIFRLDAGLAARTMLAGLPAGQAAAFRDYCRATAQPYAGDPLREAAELRQFGLATEVAPDGCQGVLVATPLADKDGLPAAVIAIEGPVTPPKRGAETEWQRAIRQIATALTPVAHHYAHVDPSVSILALSL